MHSNQFFITRPTGIAKYKMQIAQINFLFVVFYATKKKCASFIGNVLLQYTEPDKPDENHRCRNGYTKSEETKDLFSKNTLHVWSMKKLLVLMDCLINGCVISYTVDVMCEIRLVAITKQWIWLPLASEISFIRTHKCGLPQIFYWTHFQWLGSTHTSGNISHRANANKKCEIIDNIHSL